jgi:glycosyltransferase involved in cell wall biosynthesis
MSPPRISIALASYNGARYLQEQLDSLSAQRRLPDELIVFDDASRDDTVGILETFRATAPFEVKVHRNASNLGYSANFELAISRCAGDIIFMSDQDDVWFPEKIETVTRLFEQEPQIMVVSHNHIITNHDLTHDGVTKLQNIRSLGLPSSWLKTGCCTAFRRQWLEVVLPIPHATVTYDLWICQMADLLGVRRILPQSLLYYRRHGANASMWMACTPKRVTPLIILREYGLRDTREPWARQADAYRTCIERLQDCAGLVSSLSSDAVAARAVQRLRQKIEAIAARTRLVSRPRWSRAPYVLRFFRTGGYDDFSGWKSAAKDLIRP